ncbi:maleylpyruvate isomerase N-terminal domain-containing protein [Nocardioides humilatus]|uniref:maleylpyruvate isomerase N-terminal domain-containing protein n=1 Tax=Nocardioides humilatus TaxID=2607660 RepID=UPI00165FB622|nr:maleylpyruvate isomerase N-terminal domain-containing protein [Nocardioides humilatus]
MSNTTEATQHAWIDWDLDGVLEETARYADRVADLVLRAAGREDDPVPGLDWTVRQLTIHLGAAAAGYVQYFDGADEIGYDIRDLTASNEKFMTAYGDHGLERAAADIRDGHRHMVDVGRTLAPLAPLGWHAGPTPVAAVLGIALNELLLHGLDLSRALDERWEITSDAARHGLRSALALAPVVVNRDRAARVPMSYRLHVPGVVTSEWHFDTAGLRVAPAGTTRRVSCSTRVDPRAMILVAYGRSTALRATARGRALAWGRKPWAALNLASYLNVS